MTVRTFTFNPFATNCFVCHDAGEAVIVDPSCDTEAGCRQLLDYVDEHGLTVREVLLTHAHIDHVFGCRRVCDALGVGLRVHRDDLPLLEGTEAQAGLFGIEADQPPAPTGFLAEDDTIAVGSARWRVLHTPGHSPGSVSFFDEAGGFVIAGDVLFAGSIGRTDLWGASLPVLMRSIFGQIVPLGDHVNVFTGHGPATTVGAERRNNPYLAG